MRASQLTAVLLLAVALSGPAMADRLRAPDGTIQIVPKESVEFALRDGYSQIPQVFMRGWSNILSKNVVYSVDEDRVTIEEEKGNWRLTASEIAAFRAGDLANQISKKGFAVLDATNVSVAQQAGRDWLRLAYPIVAPIAVSLVICAIVLISRRTKRRRL